MKMLIAVDEQTYSEYAVKQAARLATNTWADVTLFAVESRSHGTKGKPGYKTLDMLERQKALFLESCPDGASPYVETTLDNEILEVGKDTFDVVQVRRPQKKDLKLRIRMGDPATGILHEANSENHDLVVLGCPKRGSCAWKRSDRVPARVFERSICSVFAIKEDRAINTVLCCLDHSEVSQESLEIINQMAIINNAALSLVGVTREQAIKVDVDRELLKLQEYYGSHNIETDIRLLEVPDLEGFLSSDAMPDLLALWMHKKSLLNRFIAPEWVGRLVSLSPCSVLVLR